MEFSCPENLSSPRKRAVDELVRGQACANKLKVMLNESLADAGSFQAKEELIRGVLTSFAMTLCILNSVASEEVFQFPVGEQIGSPSRDARKSECSGDSSKSCTSVKDRRGCYKRRKTSQSWTEDSPIPVDDGYAWRKYGQKMILNAKYARNYFRCTHKYDQGCLANKQVQRIEEDPPLYRTTYHGKHTCRDLLRASQLVLETADAADSVLLNFRQCNDTSFFTSFLSIKEEDTNKNDMPSDLTYYQSSSSDYLVPPDLSPLDHTDVISGVNSSCTTSTHSLEMGIIDSVDFDELEF